MRYDRSFFVPYLRDLCALYYAERKLRREIDICTASTKRIEQQEIPINEPVYEELKDRSILGLLYGGEMILATCCFVNWFAGWLSVGYVICCFLLIVATSILIFRYKQKLIREDTETHNRNLAAKEVYQNRWSAAVRNKKQEIANVLHKKEKLESEVRKLSELREKVYSANVIPSKYRDEYTSVYLYDLFSTSELENLEWALQMYVLEEIRTKLDTIICNQQQMLLNQRIMIANQNMMNRSLAEIKSNQQMSLENQARILQLQEYYSEAALSKLDSISESNEKRNIYLSMLGANSAVDAYFTASDFFYVR